MQVIYPEMGADDLQSLNNQVLLMIAEYHLTSASQGTHSIQPVLPEGAARLMPPVDEYLPGSFEGCRDVRVTDRAQILWIATWLHHLDLAATYSVETANSPQVEDYDFGPLLEYFLMPRLSTITPQEVAARVAQENRRSLETSLRDLHEERDSLQNGIGLLTTALEREQQKERRKSIKKQLDLRRRELRSNQWRIARLEGLLGLEQPQQPQQPPTAQGPLDVIIEETTETFMTDEDSESEATPQGCPTNEATAPVRETEQDMETGGEGGNSPVTPNEDDLLTGAVLLMWRRAWPPSTSTRLPNQGATMTPPPKKKSRQKGETPCRAPPGSTGRVVRPAAPTKLKEDPAGTEKATHRTM